MTERHTGRKSENERLRVGEKETFFVLDSMGHLRYLKLLRKLNM